MLHIPQQFTLLLYHLLSGRSIAFGRYITLGNRIIRDSDTGIDITRCGLEAQLRDVTTIRRGIANGTPYSVPRIHPLETQDV